LFKTAKLRFIGLKNKEMVIEPQEINIDEYNAKVTAWGSAIGIKIRASIRMLTSKGKGDLVRSLRLKTAKWYGEVDKLSYHFDRHGVFVHKGLGRGYAMVSGKVLRVSGSPKDTRLWGGIEYKKIGKVIRVSRDYKPKVLTSRSINRKPVEWFNPVVDENIEGLADMIAEMDADRIVNATKIKIK
jgi:hypothetical protein